VLISLTVVAIRSSDRPVSATSAVPLLTSLDEVEISSLISCAAVADLCARARTS
jgi:hypothetical protein